MKSHHIALLLGLAFTACKKNSGEQPHQSSDPLITDKGQPIGTPVSKSIGTAGGELASADGKVTIKVPAGAVTSNTTFSIQPITNTLYADDPAHIAYRLLPEGTTFSKPVTIVFEYDNDELNNTVEDFMTVAWQQVNGTWKIEPCALNKQAKTLTIETTHFSDWTKTGGFELKIEKEMLKSKEKSKLWVVSVTDDDLLAALGVHAEDMEGLTTLGNWKIIKGEGSLTASTNSKGFATEAVYTAPSSIQGLMNVEITMEIEGFNRIKDPSAPGGIRRTGKMILIGYLIVSDNFLTGTFDGVPFGFFGNNVIATGLGNAISIRGSDASGEVSVSVSATTAGSYPCGNIFFSGKAGVSIGSPTGAFPTYITTYFECGQTGDQKFSPSAVQISKWPAVGQFAEGSFSGPVYISDGQCGPAPKNLQLTFNVVRSN